MTSRRFLMSSTSFACSSFLLVLTFMLQDVTALLPCVNVWTGPSPDNSLAACNLGPWAIRTFGAGLLIPFIVSIITLILFLFALFGRYCCRCCGAYRRRPGHLCCGGAHWDAATKEKKDRMYSSKGIRCVKCSVFFVLVLSVFALLLVAVGVYRMSITYSNVWADANSVVTWASQQVDTIITTLTLPDGTLAGGLGADFKATLTGKVAELQTNIQKIRVDTADTIWSPISIAGYVIATVPFIFFFAGLMFACCNVRKCGPLLVILFVWLVGILFSILGLVFVGVYYGAQQICEEADAQVARQPGIFQWLVVPKCQNLDLFTNARTQIANAEISASNSACQGMTTYCSNSNVFVVGTTKYFNCPYETTFATVCVSAATASTAIGDQTTVKTTYPLQLCASVPNAQCTVRLCSTDCTNADLKSQMATVVKNLDSAVKLSTAIKVNIVPLLDCNVIIDQGVKVLAQCPFLKKNSAIIASGFYIYVLAVILLIFLMFLGQKRFFNPALGDECKDAPVEEEMKGGEPAKKK